MFQKKYKTIVVVHNDDVCWISGETGNKDHRFFQLPLEEILNKDKKELQMPEWLKGSHKTLCIIPDHWLGSQGYPFQSKKQSLIEPFLERKLKAAHPGQDAIQHFFSYRHSSSNNENELEAIFLQDEKSYRLYEALSRLNHTPRQITAPAFIWEDRLKQTESDFTQKGTLLINLAGQECQLYFYYQGNYQFSRSVMLSETPERLDTLTFEINQSLYMFSQKTKSELNCIYMFCDTLQCGEQLSESLGREIITLKPAGDPNLIPPALPEKTTLNDLLYEFQMSVRSNFFYLMHREVKQALAWRPVQWAGIAVGLILLIGLCGEHFLLRNMLGDARKEHQGLQQQAAMATSGIMLSEHSETFDQVLNTAERLLLIDAAHRMPTSFPPGVQLRQLELQLESPPSLKVTARVTAHSTDELQMTLMVLISQIKQNFKNAQALSLNDIDISLEQAGDGKTPSFYRIAYELVLT